MQSQNNEGLQQTKKWLSELLKSAVGSVVIATTTLTTPAAGATPAPAPQQEILAERVKELREQIADQPNDGAAAEEALVWHNWGNHWNNWHNWHNWANWHNF